MPTVKQLYEIAKSAFKNEKERIGDRYSFVQV